MDDKFEDAKGALSDALFSAQKRAQDTGDTVPGDPVLTTDQSLLYSIAAAMIEQAEAARPRFVQVGPVVFDPGDISALTDTDGTIHVSFKSQHARYFKGAERAAFMRWWEQNACVIKLCAED